MSIYRFLVTIVFYQELYTDNGIEPSAYEQQVTESSSFGWGFDVPGNASVPGAFMTTRFGVELYF